MAVIDFPSDEPLLATERLELWVPRQGDLWAMHAIVTDPATGRFLGPANAPADHFVRFSRNAGSWLLYGYGSFIVRERGGADVIGHCGVFHTFRGLGDDFDDSPEAGWILRHDRVGQGLAGEAMAAALAWFERVHGRRRIVALIAPGNTASLRLAHRLGFTSLRTATLPDGETAHLLERLPAEE